MVGAQEAQVPAPNHNRLFEKFVDEAQDRSQVLGFIAYGIYKTSKREWCVNFTRDNNRAPTAQELAQYHSTWTPQLIQSVETEAAQILAEYGERIVSEAEPKILRSALKGNFWRDVGTSVFAAFVYTVLLIAIALILRFSGIDLLSIIGSAASTP